MDKHTIEFSTTDVLAVIDALSRVDRQKVRERPFSKEQRAALLDRLTWALVPMDMCGAPPSPHRIVSAVARCDG